MTVKVRDVPKELSKLTMMMGRRPDSPHEDSEGHFASLGNFNGAALAVGGFQGGGCWERHTKGEELVQVIDGEADLVIMGEKGPERVKLSKGQIAVVPPGLWHRFEAPKGLTLLAATQQAAKTLELPLIAISMGAQGALSRTIGFAFGSALTFGVATAGSAPGQMPIGELRGAIEIARKALGD